jgi:citrate synthase
VLKTHPVHPVVKPSASAKAADDEGDDLHWKTAITKVSPNEIRLRGYKIDELMGQISFSQAIYLTIAGVLPSPEVGRVLDAIFVASIDHGATPPSALAARTSASTGAPYNAAVAVGLLSINKHHGGAIEDSMRMILSALKIGETENIPVGEAAARLVGRYQAEKKRLPGFGHRIHTDDPRTKKLLSIAQENGVAGAAVAMVQSIADALAQSGRTLPINVDGAMGALLLDIGIPPELGNTFFMIARVPGLVAHVFEEAARERPMRRIHPTDHEYDGWIPEE